MLQAATDRLSECTQASRKVHLFSLPRLRINE